MKTFFSAICVCALVVGLYAYFSPLPSMRARYRCFARYNTLNGITERNSPNYPTRAQLPLLKDALAEQYEDAVVDGNGMARHYAAAHVLSLALCGLLLASGIVGLWITTRRNGKEVSNHPSDRQR